MKKTKTTAFLSLFLILALMFGAPVSFAVDSEPQTELSDGDMTGKLVIIHTNDTHGGDVRSTSSIGTAGVAQLAADYRDAGARVLLISVGDAIQGDPLVNLSKGDLAIEFMNLAGYDLMVPGNHEFDYGYDNLLSLKDKADFPLISANILDKVTGETLFEANRIFEVEIDGETKKVGIFGLTTPETMTTANPKNVAFHTFLAGEALYAAARAQVEELKGAGADYIVCAAHLGTDAGSAPNRSVDIADNTEGIDLLIDGHSHSVIDGDVINGAVLSSAGTKLEQVGVVIIDGAGIETKLIYAADNDRYDSAIDEAINEAAAEIDIQLSKKFAKTEVTLDGSRQPGVRTQETNLGDFAADAILWAANEAVGGGVDASITNGGGIRASINKGNITIKDMKTVFPFGNTITTLEITGARLLEVLEAATFGAPEAVGAFPQVAGIEFTILTAVPYAKGEQFPDSTYFAPAHPGSRVVDVQINGVALDLDKTYKIATNDFLSAGGDTYFAFRELESYNTFLSLEDALERYTTEALGGVITKEMYGKAAGRIHIDDKTPSERNVTGVFIRMLFPAIP